MDFGVQTFTVRRTQQKSLEEAYLPLIQMGIRSLEVARIKFSMENARRIKALSEKYDIRISSIQVKPKQVFGEAEKIIEFCNIVGCRCVVISMLPFKCILGSEKSFYNFVDSLDGAYETYAENGITLAYHHHNWEYIKLSCGKSRMEELLERTEKIRFVHDTYWTARSGIAPSEQIRRFGKRLQGVHLRDLTFKRRGIDVIAADAAIGDGVISFVDVLAAAEEVGCDYYVIEQNTEHPYEEIEKSLGSLLGIKAGLSSQGVDL